MAEPAYVSSLRWLKQHQAEDGRWDVDGWADACSAAARCAPDAAGGDGLRDVGLTSTVLLTFLASGHTHRFGTFKQTVNKGLNWLKRRVASHGLVTAEAHHLAELDDHLLATIALCEAYAISRDFTLKKIGEQALAACLVAQDPDGGWSRGDSGPGGQARTARALLALKAAKTAGLDVPEPALARAREWLARATTHDHARSGRPHDAWRCAASLSVFARLLWGERRSTPFMQAAGEALAGRVEGDGPCAWYAPTLAAFQLGATTWSAWHPTMQKALLETQVTTGCEAGSWAPAASCGIGGRVEATALATLCLETHHRYERATGN